MTPEFDLKILHSFKLCLVSPFFQPLTIYIKKSLPLPLLLCLLNFNYLKLAHKAATHQVLETLID